MEEGLKVQNEYFGTDTETKIPRVFINAGWKMNSSELKQRDTEDAQRDPEIYIFSLCGTLCILC